MAEDMAGVSSNGAGLDSGGSTDGNADDAVRYSQFDVIIITLCRRWCCVISHPLTRRQRPTPSLLLVQPRSVKL